MNKFYITSAIPYVNAKPHIGHALEFVQTDLIARYYKLKGYDVCMLCGGDENALKNVQAAEKAGKPVQSFIDENNQLFFELTQKLYCQYDVWQKGSNQETHYPSSQQLWNLCDAKGDIYKKSYEGLYCLGCEAFYAPEELNDQGECFEHPGKKLETVKEENYFFKLSRYQQQLIKLINTDTLKIDPEIRKNEVLSFLKQPLQDISISRSNERARNWGVPVPTDSTQRMYVWFDALNIYQSGIGFGWNNETYNKWWPADIHVIGKGISRFHAVYWPAFLLSANLKLPKSLFVHGYFTVNGQKMSKTLGNVVDPIELIQKYENGADALRYYFLREIPPFADGDFSERRFTELYNADLANGLGNLASRLAKLIQNNNIQLDGFKITQPNKVFETISPLIEHYKFNEALGLIWSKIKSIDRYINDKKPWEQNPTEFSATISEILLGTKELDSFLEVVDSMQPFLPSTSAKLIRQFTGKEPFSNRPLFPRIQTK